MRNRETIRPYTVPIHAPDSTFVSVYAWDIQRQPLLLIGLRRDDGTPYLPISLNNRNLIQPTKAG